MAPYSSIRARNARLPHWRWGALLAVASALAFSPAAQGQNIANLQNLDFENTTDFAGWTRHAYAVDGTGGLNNAAQGGVPGLRSTANPKRSPTSFIDLNLSGASGTGTSAVLRTAVTDNNNAMVLPAWGSATARIHSGDNSGAAGGTDGKDNTSSGISQTFAVTASDIGKRITFAAAPVLGEPNTPHTDNRQSYFFIAITNETKGTTLYSAFNFAGESGVNWQTVGSWKFTDWQLVDVTLDAANVSAGDNIKIEVIAAGCADGGHAGYVYLDVPKGLEVVAAADKPTYELHTNPDGSTDVIYTYTYRNTGNTAVDNVTVKPSIPALSIGASSAGKTTFLGVNPNGGTCTDIPATGANSTTMSCNFGTLNAGESKTFTMTVRVPPGVSADKVVNGSYPISGDGATTIDGPIVRSNLVADMVPDLTGLPGTYALGQSYSGSFTCTNQGATTATGATCSVANLPPNVTMGQCTMGGVNWSAPAAVPAAGVVTCPVSGTPLTEDGPHNVTATTGAGNDGNVGNNTTQKSVTGSPDIRIDLTDLTSTATVGQPYTGSFTCTNIGSLDATAGTTCEVSNLPGGLTQQACSISPSTAPWVAGNAIPVGAVVTCPVTGTPTNNKGQKIVDGSTGATGDVNAGNNTAQKTIDVVGVPSVVIDLGGLPTTGTAGQSYEGSFTCNSNGTADADNSSCVVANLPPGVTQGACTITPNSAAWVSPAMIPEGETVTCLVSGKPSTAGESTVDGTGGSSTASTNVKISAAAIAPVPTLSEWAQILMAGLLAALGVFMVRQRRSYRG